MTRRIAPLLLVLIAALGGPGSAQATRTYANDDLRILEGCTKDSLENAKTNQTTVWRNPDTGTMGSVTPIQTFQNEDGQYCREYRQTIAIGDREEQAHGTACRMPDGSWQIVHGATRASSPPPPEPTLIYRERVVYERVYRPVWRPFYPFHAVVPFALSIAFGNHHGHGRVATHRRGLGHRRGHHRGRQHRPARTRNWRY